MSALSILLFSQTDVVQTTLLEEVPSAKIEV